MRSLTIIVVSIIVVMGSTHGWLGLSTFDGASSKTPYNGYTQVGYNSEKTSYYGNGTVTGSHVTATWWLPTGQYVFRGGRNIDYKITYLVYMCICMCVGGVL